MRREGRRGDRGEEREEREREREGQRSCWCPKPQFKTGANTHRSTQLKQLEAFMGSPQAFLLSFIDSDNVSPSLTGDHQSFPYLPHFGSSLSIWHFPSAAKPSPGQVSWAPVPLHCWSPDKESPECPLDIDSTQLWLPQHSSGAGKWAGRFLSSLLAVDKDTSEQEKWRCNPVHVCSWQTEETPTSIEFWVDYPDISLDSNTGLETKHG